MNSDGEDRRRPQRHLEEVDGGQQWYRVRLEADLGTKGYVTGTIVSPVTPADPSDPSLTDADFWRFGGTITKIYNGLPSQGTIPAGNQCWITKYFGRWCVVIPEC